MKKRLLCGIIVITMMSSLVMPAIWAQGNDNKAAGFTAESAENAFEKETIAISDAQTGDIVTFGAYEQDNNLDNGPEPIEWEVLDIQDDKALLLSKYALDCQPYHFKRMEVTWETCTLRKWLNENFYSAPFNPSEAISIAETTVFNYDNTNYNTAGGNTTSDRIFLLSLNEIEQYYGIGEEEWFSGDYMPQESLICRLTDYGVKRMIEQHAKLIDSTLEISEKWYTDHVDKYGQNFCLWWLRSPGVFSHYATFIYCFGSVYDYGDTVDNGIYAVRPALWIKK